MPTTLEVLYQSVLAFIVLLALARLMGKRQIAQLTFFDYIVGITIGSIAGSWSLDQTKNIHAVSSLLVWTGLSMIVAFIQRKSYRGRVLMDGRPTVIVQRGHVLEDNLRKTHLSIDEVMLLLRQKDVFKLTDIEYAILEANGSISVMKKSELMPVTPRDAGIPVVPEHEPRLVIIDGHLMGRSLAATGYTREWLLGELKKQGASDLKDVFVAQIDSTGKVYVDLYRDDIQGAEVKVKPLVAASLKKIQADLEVYALETKNQEAKQSYAKMASRLERIVRDLEPYLRD